MANKLTGVIQSSTDALDMLWWALTVFEKELSTQDSDGSSQGFALIAFAQASASLHQWVTKERFLLNPDQDRGEIFGGLLEKISWCRELRAVAEAARHGNSSSKYWDGENIPILRGDEGRFEELDGCFAQEVWFQNMMRGLSDGSLWFESHLNGVDARKVITNHYECWHHELKA